MKSGLAAAMVAADVLYERRDVLSGEVVLTFVGDEETGAPTARNGCCERYRKRAATP